METKAIADSDFLIDLLRRKTPAVDLAEQMQRQGAQIHSTSINVFELWLGALKLGKKAETMRLVDQVEILPFDRDAALSSAEIIQSLSKQGKTIDYRDAFIAGIARSRNISTIISRDESFARVEGLNLQVF